MQINKAVSFLPGDKRSSLNLCKKIRHRANQAVNWKIQTEIHNKYVQFSLFLEFGMLKKSSSCQFQTVNKIYESWE